MPFLGRQFGATLDPGRLDELGGEDDALDVYRNLHSAVLRHGFVVVRDQRFTDTALMALGRQFGAIEERVIKYSTIGPSVKPQPSLWHHHSNCNGSLDDWLLYYTPAVPEHGGSTELFDSVAWFELLSEADKQWARQQQVRHDFSPVAHAGIPPIAEPAWHPMVTQRITPEGVQEALYLGGHAVELADGSVIAEGTLAQPLVRILALARTPGLRQLHEARPHDLLIWDLKAVAHRGHPWSSQSLRVIHEVVVREIKS
ncbi:TauD/TfdA dioxygenase family protein [Ottowia thiooxydans]|uniref:Alpha-ketoglutarate-dependent 2,4-dichlorophenoxyacetate dioxygenase n=1 Tax=Ottowia thiooxydans TaxID=219182 RepID=A0ABV2Q274_9BURK